jgi:hypothetical protein
MDLWIEKIWKPHALKFKRSLLLLDQFRVHRLDKYTRIFENLCTDVLFIPPGLTSRLQPLDVLVNKPLKDALRSNWELYMLNTPPVDSNPL